MTGTARTTLARVFGPGVAYLSRRSPNLHGWSPPAAGHVDFQTGLQLPVAGPMPYLVCAGAATPAALALYAEAGLPVVADLFRYRSVSEYFAMVAHLIGTGYRLAPQRIHPVEEIPDRASLVSAELLGRLNDKGRMAEVVPREFLPHRTLFPRSELPAGSALVRPGHRVVLKASSILPSGGGHGVWIASTPEDVERARLALGPEEQMVVEEFLPVDRSACVHAAVYPDGSSEVFGVAEEVCQAGRWYGNWLDQAGDQVPKQVLEIVGKIVVAASELGYRGIVGVDVALCRDGRVLVLDLNFRVCGSTAAAWLRPWLEATRGITTIRVAGWTGPAGFDATCRVVRAAVKRGSLIPLSLYDPEACEMGGVPRLGGLVVGGSRAEVEEEVRRLAAAGLG